MKIQELTNHKRCFDGKDATRVHGILESEGPNLHVEIGYDDVNRGNEVTFHSPRAKLGLESEAVLQEEANIKSCFGFRLLQLREVLDSALFTNWWIQQDPTQAIEQCPRRSLLHSEDGFVSLNRATQWFVQQNIVTTVKQSVERFLAK